MNYLVVDLEMCKVPKNYRGKKYRYANEIIQIGAVLLDENYERIGTLNQFVHPEYGVIDHFISNLTGINNSQVKNAPLLEEALIHMADWLGDREYQVYAWSGTDYAQLQHELKCKNICNEKVGAFMQPARWTDYQAVYGKRFASGRTVSLEEALISCDIDTEGRLHDGLDDAVNTAKLIRKLEENPDFEIVTFDEKEYMSSEPLNFSMGALFANLNLKSIA